MTSGVWSARYPDLTGKVALVTGDDAAIVEIAAALAANGAPVCAVAAERTIVDAAVASAEANGAMGVVSSPDATATWDRVLPHAEQRLGPLDVIIAVGSLSARQAVIAAAVPDMSARRRGVVVEVSDDAARSATAIGVRHRFVVVAASAGASDVAACVVLCASDVLTTPSLTIHLGD